MESGHEIKVAVKCSGKGILASEASVLMILTRKQIPLVPKGVSMSTCQGFLVDLAILLRLSLAPID